MLESLAFSVDESDGSLSIKSTMPEAVPAAQMAESARLLLQEAILDYRLSKAKEKLGFIEEQHTLKKEEFLKAQGALASYIDRNAFNNTARSQIQRQKLESEFNLASSIYRELEQQKLSQSIKIQEDTPLFTVLNPAIVPLKANESSAIITIFKYLIFGFFFAALVFAVKKVLMGLKVIWLKS